MAASFEIRSRFSPLIAWMLIALAVVVFVPGIIYSVATVQVNAVVVVVTVFVVVWSAGLLRIASTRVVADGSGVFFRNPGSSRTVPWSQIAGFHVRERGPRVAMVDMELTSSELIALAATVRRKPAQVELFVTALSAWLPAG